MLILKLVIVEQGITSVKAMNAKKFQHVLIKSTLINHKNSVQTVEKPVKLAVDLKMISV